MINKWAQHPALRRTEELLVHVDHMRAPTVDNLAAVMGLSKKTVMHVLIPKLRKENKKYLEARKLKGRGAKKVYSLGTAGCEVVADIYNAKVPYYEHTGAHDAHFVGINNILTRFVGAVGLRTFKQKTSWFFTRETRDYLQKQWSELLQHWIAEAGLSEEQAAEMLHQLPEPDARLETPFLTPWIEFDNDTEGRGKLMQKLDDYISTLVPLQNKDPIIWVVTKQNPYRAFEIQTLWEEVKQWPEQEQRRKQYGEHFFFPEMYFFVEGKETGLLSLYLLPSAKENIVES